MKTNEQTKECFSYIRFSSKGAQAKGTSEGRQMEIAPRVAAENGWHFNQELNAADLGISASKGDNLETLEAIIEKANAGVIKKGTVLIIESMNRLTRLDVDTAYQLLRKMLLAGIEIYTDNNRRHLTTKDLTNPMSIMLTVSELDAAYQYTAELAKRIKKSWDNKRKNGNVKFTKFGTLSKVHPAWLEIKNNQYVLVPEKAKIVKRIFQMYLDGNGVSSIATKLNAENIKPFGRGKVWDTCYVGKLVTNHNVIGELRCRLLKHGDYRRQLSGEVIKNHYPAVIDENTFYLAQEKYSNNFKCRVREVGKTANIFAGVAYCACCGGRMNKINGGSPRNNCYLACRNRQLNKGCDTGMMKYLPIENSFLQIIGDSMELFIETDRNYEKEISALNGKIIVAQKQIDTITNAAIDGTLTKALVKRQSELEADIESWESQIKVCAANAKSGNNLTASEIEKACNLKNTLSEFGKNYPLRKKVREFCIANLERITFDVAKLGYTVKTKAGKEIEVKFSKDYSAFKLNGEIWTF